MDPETLDRPAACTLDAPAFRLRGDEFTRLFARSLQRIEPIDARCARLVLAAAAEGELRELLAREQRCCSFFDFEVEASEHAVSVTVRVPEGSEAALAFLLGLAAA